MTPEEAINTGLQSEFKGESHYSEIKHGGRIYKTASSSLGGNQSYGDMYTGNHNGVVGVDAMPQLGRVYSGKLISNEKLAELGITGDDVDAFLKKVILRQPNTRLYSEILDSEGDWSYTYTPTTTDDEIPIPSGDERIFYKDRLVFRHLFLISSLEP